MRDDDGSLDDWAGEDMGKAARGKTSNPTRREIPISAMTGHRFGGIPPPSITSDDAMVLPVDGRDLVFSRGNVFWHDKQCKLFHQLLSVLPDSRARVARVACITAGGASIEVDLPLLHSPTSFNLPLTVHYLCCHNPLHSVLFIPRYL